MNEKCAMNERYWYLKLGKLCFDQSNFQRKRSSADPSASRSAQKIHTSYSLIITDRLEIYSSKKMTVDLRVAVGDENRVLSLLLGEESGQRRSKLKMEKGEGS